MLLAYRRKSIKITTSKALPKLLSSFGGILDMPAETQRSEKTSLENTGLVSNEMARRCKWLWPH